MVVVVTDRVERIGGNVVTASPIGPPAKPFLNDSVGEVFKEMAA